MIKQGHYIKLEGLTKEQHTKVCRAFIAAGADKAGETEDYEHWDTYRYLGWDEYIFENCLAHWDAVNHYGPNATEITYEELVGVDHVTIYGVKVEPFESDNEELPPEFRKPTMTIYTPAEILLNLEGIGAEADVAGDTENFNMLRMACDLIRDQNQLIFKGKVQVRDLEAKISYSEGEFNRVGELLVKSGDKRMAASDKILALQARVKELEESNNTKSKMIDRRDKQIRQFKGELAQEALSSTKELDPKASAAKEWQPIETAPKDGTEILIFDECEEIVQSAFEYINDCWLRSGASELGHPEPTHWMPLPPKPEGE